MLIPSLSCVDYYDDILSLLQDASPYAGLYFSKSRETQLFMIKFMVLQPQFAARYSSAIVTCQDYQIILT